MLPAARAAVLPGHARSSAPALVCVKATMEEACVSVDNHSSHHKLPAKQVSAPSEWQLNTAASSMSCCLAQLGWCCPAQLGSDSVLSLVQPLVLSQWSDAQSFI